MEQRQAHTELALSFFLSPFPPLTLLPLSLYFLIFLSYCHNNSAYLLPSVIPSARKQTGCVSSSPELSGGAFLVLVSCGHIHTRGPSPLEFWRARIVQPVDRCVTAPVRWRTSGNTSDFLFLVEWFDGQQSIATSVPWLVWCNWGLWNEDSCVHPAEEFNHSGDTLLRRSRMQIVLAMWKTLGPILLANF